MQLAEEIKKQQVTAVEAVEAVFHQIEKQEEDYHCYITLNKEMALKKAKEIDKDMQAGSKHKDLLKLVPPGDNYLYFVQQIQVYAASLYTIDWFWGYLPTYPGGI